MKIIIVGCGKVGLTLTEQLNNEGHDITVIDKDGAKLRLAGQGYDSPNGGPKGDLYLRIRFAPHSLFHVDGTDLTYEVRIAPWEAVLGAKVKVPTLDGNVELSIPAGTGSGKKMRLRGKGLGPAKSRGDLYVRVGIDAPKDLTPKQR